MKSFVLGILSVMALWSGGTTSAAEPVLEDGVPIFCGLDPLGVSGHAAPAVSDWDSDGRKDLLVGMQTNGRIKLFINSGTDLNPVFLQGSLIRSGGNAIAASNG